MKTTAAIAVAISTIVTLAACDVKKTAEGVGAG
jgi:predicted small secreted protein